MSVWPTSLPAHALVCTGQRRRTGPGSDLHRPRLLEDLLECLASVPFPINPQIYHGLPDHSRISSV